MLFCAHIIISYAKNGNEEVGCGLVGQDGCWGVCEKAEMDQARHELSGGCNRITFIPFFGLDHRTRMIVHFKSEI